MELNQEQRKRRAEIIAEYTKLFLCTDPIDFEEAKKAVTALYKFHGYEPPQRWVYSKGPAESSKILMEEVVPHLEGDDLITICYGNHDAEWAAWRQFLIEVVQPVDSRLKNVEILGGEMARVIETCGWIFPFDELCIIQDRPEIEKVDESDRVHCEDGPAIRFRCGTEAYAVHGVFIDKFERRGEDLYVYARKEGKALEYQKKGKKVTPGWIREISNMEVRAAWMQLYGVANYIRNSRMVLIHEDEVPLHIGDKSSPKVRRALFREPQGTGEASYFLLVNDASTDRVFGLTVPQGETPKTCEQAHRAIIPEEIREFEVVAES